MMKNPKTIIGFDPAKPGADRTEYLLDGKMIEKCIMTDLQEIIAQTGKCPFCQNQLQKLSEADEVKMVFCKPCNKMFALKKGKQ